MTPIPTIPLKTRQLKIGRYAAENGPAGATRHSAVPETIGRRLKSEYLIVKSPFCDVIGLGPPILNLPSAFHGKSIKF